MSIPSEGRVTVNEIRSEVVRIGNEQELYDKKLNKKINFPSDNNYGKIGDILSSNENGEVFWNSYVTIEEIKSLFEKS